MTEENKHTPMQMIGQAMLLKIARPGTKATAPENSANTVKALTPETIFTDTGWRVLGVPFGGHISGRDTDGQAFHDGTDIWLTPGDIVNLTYYHGLGPDSYGDWQNPPVVIGRATYTEKDERGHWFDVALDESEPLAKRLLGAGPENVKASSGAVGHLVRMGEADLIDVWPVGELALFDTNDWRRPANELAVVEERKTAEADVPQDAEEADKAKDAPEQEAELIPETAVKTAKPNPVIETVESEKMENVIETQANEETDGDLKAMVSEVKALRAEIEALKKAAPATQKGAPTIVKDPKHSASFGKAFSAWIKGDNPEGFARGKEMFIMPENAKGAWEGGTDDEGGYTVPDDFYNGIVEQRTALSWVRQAPVLHLSTGRDRYPIPTEATAGGKLVVTDEEGAYNEDEGVFGQAVATIYKHTRMLKVSEEMMEGDGVGLEKYLSSSIGRSSAAAENYYLTIGSGTGMAQGVVAGATASGITTASATAITAAELGAAMGTLADEYQGPTARLLMKSATKWYLKGLTGNPFQFVSTPQGGDFFSFPALLAPDMDGISAGGKSVLFGDFGMYAFVERLGLTIARNPYLYQANGQVGVFVKQRFGGVVLQTLAFKYLTMHA